MAKSDYKLAMEAAFKQGFRLSHEQENIFFLGFLAGKRHQRMVLRRKGFVGKAMIVNINLCCAKCKKRIVKLSQMTRNSNDDLVTKCCKARIILERKLS